MSLGNNKSFDLLPSILICDTQYMTRRTFALLAKELGCGEVIEASEISDAKIRCEGNSFELIVLGIDEGPEEMALIRLIRDNLLLPKKDIPIIVMLEKITLEKLNELKSINVTEILVRPTRMKTIYDAFLRYI